MRAAAERRVGERARARCIAGSPARRRGNFLLRGQKKVTKEKALNRTPAPQARATPCNNQKAGGPMRAAALSRLTCDEAQASPHPSAQRAAARRAHQKTQPHSAPPERRGCSVFRLPSAGVQPRVKRDTGPNFGARHKWWARAQRLASARNEPERFRAPLMASAGWGAVQRLSFGDFSLARQRKVTRPPGRTPGTALATHQQQRAT